MGSGVHTNANTGPASLLIQFGTDSRVPISEVRFVPSQGTVVKRNTRGETPPYCLKSLSPKLRAQLGYVCAFLMWKAQVANDDAVTPHLVRKHEWPEYSVFESSRSGTNRVWQWTLFGYTGAELPVERIITQHIHRRHEVGGIEEDWSIELNQTLLPIHRISVTAEGREITTAKNLATLITYLKRLNGGKGQKKEAAIGSNDLIAAIDEWQAEHPNPSDPRIKAIRSLEDGKTLIEVTFPGSFSKQTHGELLDRIAKISLIDNSQWKIVFEMTNGSTKLLMFVRSTDAELFVKHFDNLREAAEDKQNAAVARIIAEEVFLDESSPLLAVGEGMLPTEDELYQFMATQFHNDEPKHMSGRIYESVSLFRHVLYCGRQGLTVALSRFYFVPSLLAETIWQSNYKVTSAQRATADSYRHAFLYWPALAFIIVFAFSIIFGSWVSDVDIVGYFIAASSAGLIAMAGSLVCGPLFNLLGVGAGGVLFSIMFGIVQVLVTHKAQGISNVFEAMRRADPFVMIVNGVIGSSAPQLRSAGLGYILACLILPAVAIGSTAWLMGNPRCLDMDVRTPSLKRVLRTALLGFAGGFSGIGIVQGFYQLSIASGVISPGLAFVGSATLVGALCYTFCVRLRVPNWKKAIVGGLAYGLFGAILWGTTILLRGTTLGFYGNSLSTGFFHAAYFTLSYAIAFSRGGRVAAFIAAAAEGVVGFVMFNALLLR